MDIHSPKVGLTEVVMEGASAENKMALHHFFLRNLMLCMNKVRNVSSRVLASRVLHCNQTSEKNGLEIRGLLSSAIIAERALDSLMNRSFLSIYFSRCV